MPHILQQVNTVSLAALFFLLPISTLGFNIALLCFLSNTILLQLLHKTKWLTCNKNHKNLNFIILIILFYMLISIIYTKADWPEIIRFFFKEAKIILLPIMCLQLQYISSHNKQALFWYFIAGATLCALSLLISRAFKTHIDLSLILAFSAISLLFNTLTTQNKILFKILLCIFFIYTLLCINYGRSGHIVFGILLLYAIYVILQQKAILSRVILVGIILFTLILSVFTMRINTRWLTIPKEIAQFQKNPKLYSSTGARITFYLNAIQLFKQKPIFGWGIASFKQAYKQSYPPLFINHYDERNDIAYTRTEYPDNPHNEYLNILVQFGAIGLLLYVVLFYVLYKISLTLPPKEKFLLMTTMLSIAAGSLFNSWLTDFLPGYLFILFSALSLSEINAK